MKQKIEIEIDVPEGYEIVRFGLASHNDWCLGKNGNVWMWTLRDWSSEPQLIVRRKNLWKDNIVFPDCIKPGWIARGRNMHIWWFENDPVPYGDDIWEDIEGGEALVSIERMLDLFFLPKEFFECDWKDSKVEVKHEN